MDFQILSLSGLFVGAVYLFAGFIDSVCGGGGLLTVPALMAIGIPPHLIMGSNQASSVVGGFAAMLTYIKNKKIHFISALFSLPFVIIGAYLGSALNMIFPERYLQILMLVMVPILAIILLIKKDVGMEDHFSELPKNHIIIASCLTGLFLGVYQGFYGPGSGMLALFAFSLFLKMDMLHANGNTKFVIVIACVVSSLNYAFSGMIIIKLVIWDTILYTVGSRIGARYAMTRGSKGIRPIMFLVIALLMIKILTDLL